MYISSIEIEVYRSFNKKEKIIFHKGINVIIGANNSGKTTVLKALDLVFGKNHKNGA